MPQDLADFLKLRAMPTARAATASRLSPYGSSCQHRIAIAGEIL